MIQLAAFFADLETTTELMALLGQVALEESFLRDMQICDFLPFFTIFIPATLLQASPEYFPLWSPVRFATSADKVFGP